MSRSRRHILIILIFLLVRGYSYGQDVIRPDSRALTKEILLVNTDKRIYLSGDRIWYSVICVNAYTNKISDLSQIAYLELRGHEDAESIKKVIRLINGKGSGVIELPPGLKTGYYTLKFHTKWMKNFSESHYSEKIIPVVNPLLKSFEIPDVPLHFRFYPEGGLLLAGIPNRLCYSLFSKYDIKSCKIVDNEGNPSTGFIPEKIDIGSFIFVPEKKEYTINITDERDSTYSYPIPQVQINRSYLRIESVSSRFQIDVIRPIELLPVFITIEKYDSVFHRSEIQNTEITTTIFFKKSEVPDGVSMAYLRDHSGGIICARPILNLDVDSNELTFTTDKQIYSTREKVEVFLNAHDTESQIVLSIYKRPENNALRMMELVPMIISGKAYFNNWQGSILEEKTWEDYLILHTRDLISGDNPGTRSTQLHPPDYGGHLISGRRIPKNKIYYSFDEAYLTVEGDPYGFYTSSISKDSLFCFPVNYIPENNTLILTNVSEGKLLNGNLIPEDPFKDSGPVDTLISLFIMDSLLSYLKDLNLENQLKYAYSITDKLVKRDSSVASDRKMLPHPTVVYLLDEYTRFPVMEEVFREIVRHIYVRKSRNDYHLKVFDLENDIYLNHDPMILIDGLPIFDVNQLMEIDPLLIESIEIINTETYIGKSRFGGVIALYSYKNDYANFNIGNKYNVVYYPGIDEHVTYVTPDYSDLTNKNNRIPDFRNLLYWNPDIEIQNGDIGIIEFYTSDNPGIYEIKINGISKGGKIISLRSNFEVTNSN